MLQQIHAIIIRAFCALLRLGADFPELTHLVLKLAPVARGSGDVLLSVLLRAHFECINYLLSNSHGIILLLNFF